MTRRRLYERYHCRGSPADATRLRADLFRSLSVSSCFRPPSQHYTHARCRHEIALCSRRRCLQCRHHQSDLHEKEEAHAHRPRRLALRLYDAHRRSAGQGAPALRAADIVLLALPLVLLLGAFFDGLLVLAWRWHLPGAQRRLGRARRRRRRRRGRRRLDGVRVQFHSSAELEASGARESAKAHIPSLLLLVTAKCRDAQRLPVLHLLTEENGLVVCTLEKLVALARSWR